MASSHRVSSGRLFEHPVARPQGSFERVHPRAMLGIDGKDEPVEEAPAVARRTAKERVEIRRQPHDPHIFRKSRRARRRNPVDASEPGRTCLAFPRFDPGAEPGLAIGAVEGDRRCKAPGPALAGHLGKLGAAQAPSRRKERQRFKQVGLAGAVLADERDEPHRYGKIECRVGAEVLEHEARDARGSVQIGPRCGTVARPGRRSQGPWAGRVVPSEGSP